MVPTYTVANVFTWLHIKAAGKKTMKEESTMENTTIKSHLAKVPLAKLLMILSFV